MRLPVLGLLALSACATSGAAGPPGTQGDRTLSFPPLEGTAPAGPGAPVPFDRPASPDGGPIRPYGLSDGVFVAVRDAEGWRALWDLTAGAGTPPPAFDFGRDMLIVAALGTFRTGGNGVEIESVVQTEGALEVSVLLTRSGPECPVSQAFTSPVDAVRVLRSELPVEFRRRMVVTAC